MRIRVFLLNAPVRLISAVALGVLIGVLVGTLANPADGVLVGIAVAAAYFVTVGWSVLWPLTAHETERHAKREDFRPVLDELITTIALLCAISGLVAFQVVGGSHAGPWEAALALIAVFLSWAGLQILYGARYAAEYYRGGTAGGIDFNTDESPCFQEFFYFSFSVGMTLGVTDPSVTDRSIRAVVLRHSILSYVFNAVVLATAINLVAGAFTG